MSDVRVVLDTNILISAFFWEGNEREILHRCFKRELHSISSPGIMDELSSVLTRKFDVQKEKKVVYIGYIATISEMVFPAGEVNVLMDDPADNMILETAYLGKADMIVTGDRKLLELRQFRDIRIARSGEILK